MQNANPDFTIKAYGELIEELLERGYETRSFADAAPQKQDLILRHDIDFSPQYGVVLARVEAALGVAAHYYFLIKSPLYNILSPLIVEQIRQIGALGHQIGLHFDASLYGEDRQQLERAAQGEVELLRDITGCPVDSLSFHRPAPQLVGLEGRFAGLLHSYDPRFVKEMGYCSDSRGEWRFGPPREHEAIKEKRALQLLIHPIWWYEDKQETPVDRVQRFLRDRDGAIKDVVADNCLPFRQWRQDSAGS